MITQSIKDKLEFGDVYAISGKSWFAKLIRFWTEQTYSHVGVVFKIGSNFVYGAEADDRRGVRLVPIKKVFPAYIIKTKVPEEKMQLLMEFIADNVGDDYSFWDCILAALGKKINTTDHKWQCAEFVNVFLQKAGIDIPQSDDTPGKIVENLLKKGFMMEFVCK